MTIGQYSPILAPDHGHAIEIERQYIAQQPRRARGRTPLYRSPQTLPVSGQKVISGKEGLTAKIGRIAKPIGAGR